MNNILQVVPIIDTEGPTHGHPDMIDSWESLEKTIGYLTGELRESLKDSTGSPLIINWFMLDWTGYSKNDLEFKRRGHDIRLHAVWNFYRERFLADKNINITKDGLYWHYHHPPLDGSWGWNKNWNDSRWYEYILGKLIINHQYFPSVYRAGKYVETNDSSHWLEKWIPFDYSSISPVKRDFCDWSQARTDWIPYHPSFKDYQLEGDMKRWVVRSLPVAAKGGSGALSIEEIEKAFDQVRKGENAIFSFHTHDYYKSINDEFKTAHEMLEKVSKREGIPWKYSNSLDALRNHIVEKQDLLKIDVKESNRRVKISFNHKIFCEIPFVIVENSKGDIKRINPKEIDESIYEFAVDSDVACYGVGANDSYGNTVVYNKRY